MAIIEEFVAREGTDYGLSEVPFSKKVDQVNSDISAGDVVICFDPVTESCTLMTRTQFSAVSEE